MPPMPFDRDLPSAERTLLQVLVDKTVALAMYITETEEEKATRLAASMVRPNPNHNRIPNPNPDYTNGCINGAKDF